MEITIGGKTRVENFAFVGYEVIITNSRYALVGYFITSYPTRAHRIIVIYLSFLLRIMFVKKIKFYKLAFTLKHNQLM